MPSPAENRRIRPESDHVVVETHYRRASFMAHLFPVERLDAKRFFRFGDDPAGRLYGAAAEVAHRGRHGGVRLEVA